MPVSDKYTLLKPRGSKLKTADAHFQDHKHTNLFTNKQIRRDYIVRIHTPTLTVVAFP